MPMHIIIAPVLIFTGIYAAIGTYFVMLYYRIPYLRSNHVLFFIASCFLAMLYNVTRIGMYYTTTCEASYLWARAAHVIIPVLAIAIAGFLNKYARDTKRWITHCIMIVFGFLAIASMVGGDHVLDKSSCTPGYLHFFSLTMPHVRFWPGIIGKSILVCLICAAVYATFHFIMWGVNGSKKEAAILFYSGLVLIVFCASDVALTFRVISFIFIGEYAFFFFILAMCYSTINQMSLFTEKEAARTSTAKVDKDEDLLKGLDFNILKIKILSIMNDEKVYADENVSVATVAKHLGIRPSQLSRFMNVVMGSDFRNFINQYRVKEARFLLEKKPDLSIKYICYEVGFQSTSTFHDAFKKFTGTTPAQYRKGFSA